MTRTEQALRRVSHSGRTPVIPFICAGFPSPGVTSRALVRLGGPVEAGGIGCPVVEVGIPFSDPIADGPVIAAAMHQALSPTNPLDPPASLDSVFAEVAAARPNCDAAIVAMVSYSIVAKAGEAGFVARAAHAGFDGLIVPDLPLEETATLRTLVHDAGLSLSLLVAPTSPAERAAAIARACTGFVYVLGRTGITGTAQGPAVDEPAFVARVADLRRVTSLPLACGFGISTGEHVRATLRHADAAIVGSAVVRAMGEAWQRGEDPAGAAAVLVRALMSAA